MTQNCTQVTPCPLFMSNATIYKFKVNVGSLCHIFLLTCEISISAIISKINMHSENPPPPPHFRDNEGQRAQKEFLFLNSLFICKKCLVNARYYQLLSLTLYRPESSDFLFSN